MRISANILHQKLIHIIEFSPLVPPPNFNRVLYLLKITHIRTALYIEC